MTDKPETDLPVLLIVEDDEGLQRQLKWAYEGYRVVTASDRDAAIQMMRQHEPMVVTLDLGLPPDPDGTSEGFATLTEILQLKPDTKVIVASGHGARESALKAIALGAYDFYRKPVDIDELGLIVGRAFHLREIEQENRRLEESGGGAATVLGGIVSAAPEMLKVARTIERVATADVSVMLLGASGTGKELLARAVHEKSPRNKGEFVAINCAAIPENLLEAELFGYERGAFTGAVKTTPGKIEQAQGGTLFLDEVGDIPLPLQVKLLRFLQERVIERIGGRATIAVDTRIVCATHQNLDAMIADGRFREDLYAAEAIDAHGWPGNVRELENRIKRAVIMADGRLVGAADLDLPGARGGAEVEALPINLRAAREIADRRAIRVALARTEHNISGAAKLLGISRPTLYDLMKQYQLGA